MSELNVGLGLGLKFNPNTLGWGTCGLGAERRATKKLGRSTSY
jgi:hypothetical protein